eukprot:798803_1
MDLLHTPLNTFLSIFISLIISASSDPRSYSNCTLNYDCHSCTEQAHCSWSSLGTDSDEFDRSFLRGNTFLVCQATPPGLISTIRVSNQSVVTVASSVEECRGVNNGWKNPCAREDRNTLETCLAQHRLYQDLNNCAWDIHYKVCANKARDKDHPIPSRFLYSLDDVPLNPGRSNIPDMVSAAIIVVLCAFIISCCCYCLSTEKIGNVSNQVFDYALHLHEARRKTLEVTEHPMAMTKTDIIAETI